MIFVTGGYGFIGANFIRDWLNAESESVLNLDALTYAAHCDNLVDLQHDTRYAFVHGNICDRPLLDDLLGIHQPRAIIHFAAESHVDRSIHGPATFIKTNIEGTFHLLEAARDYYATLDNLHQDSFRFLHVSTDEVYGSLDPDEPAFTEKNAFQPNSPYSASKAASDHLVRAWYHTYQLPVLTTHCSNNYGPYQFPEKLIPLIITHALAGKPLPIYGDGKHIRDWLYVTDHCAAIRRVLSDGRKGETYNIGGCNELSNIDIVTIICSLLDEFRLQPAGSHARLITFVKDRPGHDRRYAINADKMVKTLGWKPVETFASGIRKTVQWYLDNEQWLEKITLGKHQTWLQQPFHLAST